MPKKALVPCGVVLGFMLLAVTGSAWCLDRNSSEYAISRSIDAAPKSIEEQTTNSATALSALTLDEALTRALKQSPKLSVFSQEVKAREFESWQAGRLPNPELSIELENVAGSGDFSGTESAETTVQISQLLELGGKRSHRQELGRVEQELAEQEYAIARGEVLSEATKRFFAVLAAQKRLFVSGEQIELTKKVLQTVEDRIAEGKAAAIEKVRFKTLVTEARLNRDKARQELFVAQQTLAAVWGGNTVDFETVVGNLEVVHSAPSWSELVSMLEKSPKAALLKSTVNRADRDLALERANGIPDLTFSLGARHHQSTDDNSLVMAVSMPLQVFNRNQDTVAASLARKLKTEEEARAAQLFLRAGLAEGWRELLAAHSEVFALREEIIPANQETFDAVVYGYQAGKFGILEVLDAERTLFEAKNRYIDALKSYHQAASDLELLLGQKVYPAEDPSEHNQNQRGQS